MTKSKYRKSRFDSIFSVRSTFFPLFVFVWKDCFGSNFYFETLHFESYAFIKNQLLNWKFFGLSVVQSKKLQSVRLGFIIFLLCQILILKFSVSSNLNRNFSHLFYRAFLSYLTRSIFLKICLLSTKYNYSLQWLRPLDITIRHRWNITFLNSFSQGFWLLIPLWCPTFFLL